MPVQELLAGTTTPPATGPRVLYRWYTRSGTETWRFLKMPPTEYQGKKVVFRAIEHDHDPPKRLPTVGILEKYVDEQMARLYAEEQTQKSDDRLQAEKAARDLSADPSSERTSEDTETRCTSTQPPSSPTSPADRQPPRLDEPARPGPGLPTRSSRRKSSAQSEETTTGAQFRLDL